MQLLLFIIIIKGKKLYQVGKDFYKFNKYMHKTFYIFFFSIKMPNNKNYFRKGMFF